MAVVPVWITQSERFMLDHYRPVWNMCLDGFGNHDPGVGRRHGMRSRWDTLYPGRRWAGHLRINKASPGSMRREMERFLGGMPDEKQA